MAKSINNKQIFHTFLFNIKNYSLKVIIEYYITKGEQFRY